MSPSISVHILLFSFHKTPGKIGQELKSTQGVSPYRIAASFIHPTKESFLNFFHWTPKHNALFRRILTSVADYLLKSSGW
jgi:hypothetical protein